MVPLADKLGTDVLDWLVSDGLTVREGTAEKYLWQHVVEGAEGQGSVHVGMPDGAAHVLVSSGLTGLERLSEHDEQWRVSHFYTLVRHELTRLGVDFSGVAVGSPTVSVGKRVYLDAPLTRHLLMETIGLVQRGRMLVAMLYAEQFMSGG